MLLDQISTTGKTTTTRGHTNNLEPKQHKIQIWIQQNSEFLWKKKKTSAKAVIGGTYLNMMKAKYNKIIANIIVNKEKLKIFL